MHVQLYCTLQIHILLQITQLLVGSVESAQSMNTMEEILLYLPYALKPVWLKHDDNKKFTVSLKRLPGCDVNCYFLVVETITEHAAG